MRRIISLAATILLTVGCGGGGAPGTDPASLTSCEAVAAAAVGVIQDSIDILEAASSTGTEPDAGTTGVVEAAGTALEDRARSLGCTDEEMAALMADLADGLQARSVFGQLIIENLKAGEDGFYREG